MKIVERIANRFGWVRSSELVTVRDQITEATNKYNSLMKHVRGYDAARVSRLTSDWLTSQLSADAEIYSSRRKVIDRSRDLERNNDYVRNELRLKHNNVLGHCGIKLQMKLPMADGRTLDKAANEEIEHQWCEWGERETCTIAGDDCWYDVQGLCLRAFRRDADVFVRRIKGYDNSFAFSLQLFENDHLDVTYNANLTNGDMIRFGIEMTRNRRRIAYHFLTIHPGDIGITGTPPYRRIRIPASEITHLYTKERIGQTIGMPAIVSAIVRLNRLGRYEEAELIASLVAAAKMGFITNKTPEDYQGAPDGYGNKLMEVEPGAFEELLPGQEVQTFDPQHPHQTFAAFTKGQLRGIAAGMGESYHKLANDLESVNFSSGRLGENEAREDYKVLQGYLIRTLVRDVWRDWSEMALLNGNITKVRPTRLADVWRYAEWKGRRWGYVDPKTDIDAAKTAIRSGLTSRRAVVAENGGDVEDVDRDQQADNESAEAHGLTFPDLESDTKETAQDASDADDGEMSGVNGENDGRAPSRNGNGHLTR